MLDIPWHRGDQCRDACKPGDLPAAAGDAIRNPRPVAAMAPENTQWAWSREVVLCTVAPQDPIPSLVRTHRWGASPPRSLHCMCHRLNAVEYSNDSRNKLQSFLPDAARYSRARRIAKEAAVLAPHHDDIVVCLPFNFFAFMKPKNTQNLCILIFAKTPEHSGSLWKGARVYLAFTPSLPYSRKVGFDSMGKDYYAILGGLAKDVSHLSPDLCALSKLQHRRHGSSRLGSRSWRGGGEMHEEEWLGNPYVHHHRVAKFFLPHVDASVLNPRDRLRSEQHRARGQGPSPRTWVLLRPPRQLSSTLL